MKKQYFVLLAMISFALFFAGTIDLNALFNYANQPVPFYISEDNTPPDNPITDEGATLGRVLFYDKNLSLTNTVSCGSCHIQSLAFGDSEVQSVGHDGGLTGRHSTRLSSARFGEEEKFFWDERVNSLEEQTTQPIQDHIEMGFSGSDGDPDIDSLITKMSGLSYYNELFNLAFGDQVITEERMQDALAQFVRSMQSFDSKYDVGRAQVANNNADFPNFTEEENNGKTLYMTGNQAGCNRCHRAPEFDIDPDSQNNGIIGVAGSPGSIDLTNERSPSLRDIVNNAGVENGPFMHDGSLATLMDVINHYDEVPNLPVNTNLDNRLIGPGGNLNLTDTEKNELLAFLKTLGGINLYTDVKYSDPFDEDGNLEILNGVLPVELSYFDAFQEGEFVILEWETLEEINNDGFEVLHSVNGVDWNMLDFVFGENEAAEYDYRHTNPELGTNYYKLKQVDFDGHFKYTDIKSVRIETKEDALNIFPNPTHNYVNVNSSETYKTASVFNRNGKLMKTYSIEESTRINLSDLEGGVYFIRLSGLNGQMSKVSRVVKL